MVVFTVRFVDDMGIWREGFALIQSAPRDDRLGHEVSKRERALAEQRMRESGCGCFGRR